MFTEPTGFAVAPRPAGAPYTGMLPALIATVSLVLSIAAVLTAAARAGQRQPVAAGERRAGGARKRTGRLARRGARPRFRRQPHDLFLLRRARLGRRPHRDGARPVH